MHRNVALRGKQRMQDRDEWLIVGESWRCENGADAERRLRPK